MRYKPKRIYVWDNQIAYLVGLIASDGCLLNDGRHIDFTSKDLQLVEAYRSIIRPTAKIGNKLSGSGQAYYRVQLGDVSLYDFLLKVGLTPAKSHTIGKLLVPDELFADFLRGVFDGDGSVSAFQDKRWKNSYMFYTTYASASLQFLEWLQQTIAQLLPYVTGGYIHGSKKSIYQLSYAKRDSRQLFQFMYHDQSLARLERKYQRYLEIFALDPYASKEL